MIFRAHLCLRTLLHTSTSNLGPIPSAKSTFPKDGICNGVASHMRQIVDKRVRLHLAADFLHVIPRARIILLRHGWVPGSPYTDTLWPVDELHSVSELTPHYCTYSGVRSGVGGAARYVPSSSRYLTGFRPRQPGPVATGDGELQYEGNKRWLPPEIIQCLHVR